MKTSRDYGHLGFSAEHITQAVLYTNDIGTAHTYMSMYNIRLGAFLYSQSTYDETPSDTTASPPSVLHTPIWDGADDH